MNLVGRGCSNGLLLASGYHVATHVECVVMGPVLGGAHALVCRIGLNQIIPSFHSLFGINRYRRWLGWRLLDATAPTVEALVENFALVREVTRARLVGLRRLRVVTILAVDLDLRLIQALCTKYE